MCLAIVALNAHPRYPVVVAANRDEFHDRPALPAAWWRDREGYELLGGRDLQAGGTWLGVTRHGRWAFVTNVREPGRRDATAVSRGALVTGVLSDPRAAAVAVTARLAEGERYNGFNLLAGDAGRGVWASNRAAAPQTLSAGIHGVSNAALDTPWPKLRQTRDAVAAWTARGAHEMEHLFELLGSRSRPPDAELPATGVPLEWERLLSSPFIVSETYGTRCSTVLTIDADGRTTLVERSFDRTGTPTGEVAHEFRIDER